MGGSAFLITTKPGFEMEFKASTDEQSCPFHPQSPAGLFYENNREFYSSWNVSFTDHYQGRGGFGASTAQFIGLSFFKRQTEQVNAAISQSSFYKSIWQDYQDINTQLNPNTRTAHLPSGYDLWAQLMGAVCAVKRITVNGNVQFNHRRMVWPFSDLEFYIVPTGFKVATHEHLGNLDPESLKGLSQLSDTMMVSLHAKDSDGFIDSLRLWNKRLTSLKLVHPHTQELLGKLNEYSEIVVAKGCGALGADILFVAFKRSHQQRVKSILNDLNLNEAYDHSDLWEQEVRVQLC